MKKSADALKKLNMPIGTCKNCFNDFKINSFRNLICKVDECEKCFNLKKPIFYSFKTQGCKCLAIYEYDELIKGMIYTFKGCKDIELRNTFLGSYSLLLRLMFFKYVMVPVPSYFKDNEERGFNHVEEIFRPLKLKFIYALEKIDHHKQSDQKFQYRKDIKNYIKLVNNQDLQGKSILLVDDIYTTGSTINACIDLLKTTHPKRIKVLVLAKVMRFEK